MRCHFRHIRRIWFAAVAATAMALVLICYADVFLSRDELTEQVRVQRHARVKEMVSRLKGDHKLAFCPLYKSASSSWLMTLSMLHNISMDYIENSGKQLSDIARSVVPSLGGTEAIHAMGESLRLMIVRNPLERILSAYRDKLENRRNGLQHGTEHFYQNYGKEIVQKYRSPRIHPELKNRDEPTFPEFIQYLIDTDLAQRADDHWIPYYLFCTPCWVDYDVIAKFETIQEDFEFVIEVAELEKYGVQPPWRHLTKGVRTQEVENAYYASITKEQVLQLYEKYKPDFELFEYDFDRYFDLAK